MLKQIKLKNGLKVFLQQSQKSPVVSIQMWVRTGSADEGKGVEGISHFIEHLVFKGSEKYKVGEIASVIEGSGGELNAYTSFDQTVFYVTLSKNFIQTGMSAISQMMGYPLFDPQEIDNEREVVIEEIKRGQDSPGRRASQLLFSTAYKGHPYSIPVIGFEKNIRKVSVKKIWDYYHARYSPQNMFLVVAGDIDFAQAKKLVQEYFANIPTYKVAKVQRKKELPQKAARISVEKAEFQQSLAYLGFKIPSIAHADIPGLDMLSMILGMGDSSRLVQKLRIEKAWVNSVGASTYNPKDKGLFLISMGFNPENIQGIFQTLQEEILRFFQAPPTADEIRRALVNLESEEYYSLESVDGIARKLGHLEFYFQDQKALQKYLKALHAMTAEKLLKLAKKYFNPEQLTVTITTNADKNQTLKFIKTWTSGFSKELKKLKTPAMKKQSMVRTKWKMPAAPSKQNFEKVVLKNGTHIYFQPLRDTFTFSARAAFLGGLRFESPQDNGVSEMFSRIWLGGTTHRSENELAFEIEEIAAGFQAVAGKNSMGLSFEALSSFEQQGRHLFFDVLASSKPNQDVFDREKHVLLEQIKSKADNPFQIAHAQFMKKMFGQHVYSLESSGTKDSVSGLKLSDAKKHFEKWASTKNLHLCVAGRFDREAWLEAIEHWTERMPHHKVQMPAQDVLPLKENLYSFHVMKKEQSHVLLGYRGLTLTDSRRPVLDIIESVLAGQGGRLFIELRDKASLAYSVSPMKLEGLDTGFFGSYIGCSPDKVDKAIQMMHAEFDKLSTTLISEEELDRAQRYILGHHDIELQRTSAISADILYNEIYGLDHQDLSQIKNRIMSVSRQDILKLSQEIFSSKCVLSVAGPIEPKLNQI